MVVKRREGIFMTYKEKVRFLEQYQSNLSRQRMLEE